MTLRQIVLTGSLTVLFHASNAQTKWQNKDSLFGPLPASVHVYYTNDPQDTANFQAWYLVADLQDPHLAFIADTVHDRRLTPAAFYTRDQHPLAIVNCTFFSFATNRSLNTVIRNGQLVAFNEHTIPGRGKDTFTYRHPFHSAIGINKNREADVAWLFTDSSMKWPRAIQQEVSFVKDSARRFTLEEARQAIQRQGSKGSGEKPSLKPWKMETAVGGGPVLVQNGRVHITNNEELKFAGKAVNDKHPRTAMGYTADHRLVIMVVQGRSESSSGASLVQLANLLQEVGCVEALNLDGGGSSCLLINGRETIKPSDKEGERAVPAVFMIRVH